jgi:hypothetical protein
MALRTRHTKLEMLRLQWFQSFKHYLLSQDVLSRSPILCLTLW